MAGAKIHGKRAFCTCKDVIYHVPNTEKSSVDKRNVINCAPTTCLHIRSTHRVVLQRNCLAFVKIILLKSDNCALTLRKRLFCNAKPTLLPCKTAAFGMQNNRFYNTLITKQLHNRYACEKYLHYYRAFFAYGFTINEHYISTVSLR